MRHPLGNRGAGRQTRAQHETAGVSGNGQGTKARVREPEAPDSTGSPLLRVDDFHVGFSGERGALEAVRGVSFAIAAHEKVGIVGESGSGKSVLAQSILRLLEHEETVAYRGSLSWRGTDLLGLPLQEMAKVRGSQIAMVFQDPQTSLDPLYSVGYQLVETIRLHSRLARATARKRALELLEDVGIHDAGARLSSYPSELSGGMLQRVMIALAISAQPRLLIADEPTTALDTTTQQQILDLIGEISEKTGMAVLFISHDLGVVANLCTRVLVMYLGRIVEAGPSAEIFASPLHPYTHGLLDSIPPLSGERPNRLPSIPGAVPDLASVPAGCAFAPRCAYATQRCHEEQPELREHAASESQGADGERTSHLVACWHAQAWERGQDFGEKKAGDEIAAS